MPTPTNHETPTGQKPAPQTRETEGLEPAHCPGLIDAASSESFDRITELAAEVLEVPITLISLIDQNRQWVKTRGGLDLREAQRDASFFVHAVKMRRSLAVADATKDLRFAANPLVVGQPFIRAYLGIPLYGKAGQAVGTLCAIDVQPREFTAKEVRALSGFAKIVEDLLHARELAAAAVARQTQTLKSKNQELQAQIRRVLNSERSLRVVEHRLRAITNNIPVMIGYWNTELQCEFANNAYQEVFRVRAKWSIGTSMRVLLGDGHFSSVEPLARLALAGEPQHFVRRTVKSDGSVAYIEVRFIPDFDETGNVRGFYVLADDVTEARNARIALEATNEKLARESATDYLTGLSNRRVFSERSEAAARRFKEAGEAYGLILLDLDNFKQVNDEYGHDVGDEVLRAVGLVLKDQLRCDRDIAARLGGEEFAILCFGNLEKDSLRTIAERVREQVAAASVNTPKGVVRFTGSFGIAMCDANDVGWKNIYARADAALYEAKAAGKNRVEFGSASTPAASERYRSMKIVATR
jgi:diguanylate cyclase (GGDEF)-like protein/PAS domain S-box-containing protein